MESFWVGMLLNERWRTGILCAECRLRPKGLPPYVRLTGDAGTDFCNGHGFTTSGVYVQEEYPVVVAVMK